MRGGAVVAAMIGMTLASGMSAGCGSSGGDDNPQLPDVVIIPETLLVDVGARVNLDGSETTDPEADSNDEILYFWTALNETATVTFDDRCEDDVEQICDENSDDLCQDPQTTACTTNADCEVGNCDTTPPAPFECEQKQNAFCNNNDDCAEGDCAPNSGTTSPDCTEGICLLGEGREQVLASFIAPAPGPYEIRLLAEGRVSNNVGTRIVNTYPSMFLVGSLIAFGGTEGGLIGESADVATFAPNAVRGIGDPATGNILLADPVLGIVREFDFNTLNVVGTFGETAIMDEPVALAFDGAGDLYAADEDGTVDVFSGSAGLSQGTFADVTLVAEQVTAILFEPTDGNLLVVDGRAGQGLREYDIATGAFVGFYGDTATAAVQAVDAAFLTGAAPGLLIADAAGDVKLCSVAGTACGPFGSIEPLLAVNGPTAIDVNPSAAFVPESAVVVADAVNNQVVACAADGSGCTAFGETAGLTSAYLDVFFAPPVTPTPDTTTTTTSTTLPAE